MSALEFDHRMRAFGAGTEAVLLRELVCFGEGIRLLGEKVQVVGLRIVHPAFDLLEDRPDLLFVVLGRAQSPEPSQLLSIGGTKTAVTASNSPGATCPFS